MDQHVSTVDHGSVSEQISSAKEISAGRRRLRLRSVLLATGALVLLVGAGFYGHYYWTAGRFLVSTDDAYLQADNVIISPKVSGYISDVLVQDNQPVKAGQVLARIDDRDYRTALAAAQANVDAAEASIDNLMQQIAEQQLTVAEARATVETDQAALTFANQDYQRYTQPLQDRRRHRAERAAGDVRHPAKSRQCWIMIPLPSARPGSRSMCWARSWPRRGRRSPLQQAALHQAELNVGYTTITVAD